QHLLCCSRLCVGQLLLEGVQIGAVFETMLLVVSVEHLQDRAFHIAYSHDQSSELSTLRLSSAMHKLTGSGNTEPGLESVAGEADPHRTMHAESRFWLALRIDAASTTRPDPEKLAQSEQVSGTGST